MDNPVVKHVSRRRPGREVPDLSQECYQESGPSDCIILPDTNILLSDVGYIEKLNGKYPGKVWIPVDIHNELKGIKKEPNGSSKREEIKDFCDFMKRIYASTSRLDGEPFHFPTFKELLLSDDEKAREAAETIKAAANCSYGGSFSNGRASWVDMSLFIGPVYGNGDFPAYQWIVLSEDRKVISTGENLRNDGYRVVAIGDRKSLNYHAEKFL